MKRSMLDSYGKYFETGIYSERYNDDVSMRAYHAVRRLIYNTLGTVQSLTGTLVTTNNLVLKIVDYGCGNGRYFHMLKSIANSLKNMSITLEVTGVDPIIEGLSAYKRKLLRCGFLESGDVLLHSEVGSVQELSVMENQNLNMRVRLIKNSISSDLKVEARIIGKQHCGLCMFGVLSHIEARKRRQDAMCMLCTIVEGSTLYSLPNAARCFIEEQKFFGSRDIVYSRNEEISLPYHLYTKDEIEADIRSFHGFSASGICSASVFDETMIMSNTLVNMLDFFISEHMPFFCVEYFSKYFLFEVARIAEDNVMLECEETSCDYSK
ncbi:MAG: hypothetical protein K2X50_02390 [Gammaproteobacteria bacterium]|nr:hypothetical protein [Gammaproteobacteria bacterium]